MNQSSVAGTKRKPSMLSLQPPKLKSPELPRTPYPMPSKGWKRSVSFSEEEDSPQEGETKKRKTAGYKALLSTPSHLASFPSLDSGYLSASQRHGIPSVVLMKAWESILDQVDWSEVMQDAGGRGKPNIYRDVFQTIVQAHAEEQLKQEECREDMIFEHSKRDDDTDAESGNDSSEDGAGDGFQHFEDNIFVESDESEFESEDYADDENDDEEDSDDEDQDDDDYEVIDDGVSI